MKASQLALDLALKPDYSEAAFCITDANAVAWKAVQRWPQWRMGHLLLLGPAGSGKTHLARIWSTRASAVSLAADQLTAALNQVQRGAAVLLEDLQDGVDEDGLFHLLNRAAGDAGVTVLMTASRPPADWPVALPDLASRLTAAETAVLNEPDDALLRQVMEKLLRDRRTPIKPGVLEYLLTRMERSVDYARALTAWLDRQALARKGPVTRTLAREGLAALSNE
jgi:chromosomal replication initiation ATPase DnaA